jgi:UPF0755 protein
VKRLLLVLLLPLAACDVGAAPDPSSTDEFFFEVPPGSSARGLGDALQKAGLVRDSWRWKWFLRSGADSACIKAGRHKVAKSMDATALLAALCGKPVPKEEPFTVVEGWRVREIDAALVAKGWIKPGEYTEAAREVSAYHTDFPLPKDGLEGYLYPETYNVEYEPFDPKKLVQRQLDTFAERFWTPHHGDFTARTLPDIVTMASLIEREEPSPTNRPLIAGILWRRIDAGWNLGVDATSRYTLDDWNDRDAFMAKLRDPNDPWNTRLKKGLPPTPIGNPGVVALEAALKPQASDYWYYLHDSTQTLHPSRNVAEHEAFRRKYNVY